MKWIYRSREIWNPDFKNYGDMIIAYTVML